MGTTVSVLDIGTSKVTCMVADSVGAGEFVVRAIGVCSYNGYDSNGFFEPDSVYETISRAISVASNSYGKAIKSIVVGVPTAFVSMGNSEASSVFRTKKKIDLYDIGEIINRANIFGDIEGVNISKNTLYYSIDDDNRMIFNPVGMVVSKIMGVVSFGYMHKPFDKIVSGALSKCGIRNVSYVNGAEVQAKYVSLKYSKNYHAITIDIGHINSSVMLSVGKGVLLAKSFELGSGYIAGDLSQVLHISYKSATELLGKIDLSLDFGEEDTYNVGGIVVPANKANDIARARIEQIARYIKKCFSMYDREVPASTPIVLTGGGLAYMRGGVQCLSQYLGKEVVLYASDNPQTDHNEYNSAYAIVSHELSGATKPVSKGGLFARWRR